MIENILSADRECLIFFTFTAFLYLIDYLYIRGYLTECLRVKHSKSYIKKQNREYRKTTPLVKRLMFLNWREDVPEFSLIFLNFLLHLCVLTAVMSVPLWILFNNGIWNPALRITVLFFDVLSLISGLITFCYYLRHYIKYGKDGTKNQRSNS